MPPFELRIFIESRSDISAGPLSTRLSLNNPAGNPWSRVPCRIGFVIVLFCMDDESRSAVVKDRIWPVAERYHRVLQSCFRPSVCVNFDVQEITSVRSIRVA